MGVHGRIAAGACAALVAGVAIGFALASPDALCAEKYEFLGSGINCNTSYSIDKHSYLGLRSEMEGAITEMQEAGDITSASVYFRDLERGPTFGVNEYSALFPATLLKLTLLTTYYEYAEGYPEVLTEMVSYTDAASTTQDARVRDLLARVAKDSDDAAYKALKEHLLTLPDGSELLSRRGQELGLILDPESGLEEAISVKAYSLMLHSLFFARFLSPHSANEVLRLLEDVPPRNGIAAVIPDDVRVAHRLGTPTRLFDGRIRMHDCGIVYYPGNPYSLCIAAMGEDEAALEATITTIARMVYDEVKVRRVLHDGLE